MQAEDVYLTEDELATRLSVSVHWIRRMRQAKRLPGVVRISDRKLRYDWPEIKEWMEARKEETKGS